MVYMETIQPTTGTPETGQTVQAALPVASADLEGGNAALGVELRSTGVRSRVRKGVEVLPVEALDSLPLHAEAGNKPEPEAGSPGEPESSSEGDGGGFSSRRSRRQRRSRLELAASAPPSSSGLVPASKKPHPTVLRRRG